MRDETTGETDTVARGSITPPPDILVETSPRDFLQRWVDDNPYLGDRVDLLRKWTIDPKPREDIAREMGIPLGQLLRSFNDTAPLGSSRPFRYRTIPFSVVPMLGICDDLAEGRYPMFGEPVTLRCYLENATLMPQGMFEAADWNFMDGGLPGFLGYAYGVRFGDTLYLAGVQSDIGVRYGYLFQGRGETTEVRLGDEVLPRSTTDVRSAYGPYVPVLRRTFQRYWIPILLAAVLTWAEEDPRLSALGLLQFPREPEENRQGHVVHRVYRDLPERLGASMRCVAVGQDYHRYAVAPLIEVQRYLGDRWKRG